MNSEYVIAAVRTMLIHSHATAYFKGDDGIPQDDQNALHFNIVCYYEQTRTSCIDSLKPTLICRYQTRTVVKFDHQRLINLFITIT
jgi:hypothetical protein